MKRALPTLLVALLCLCAAAALLPLQGQALDVRDLQDVAALHGQIQSLNLINHLYLSKEQAGRLLTLARENASAQDAALARFATQKSQYMAALEALRNELMTKADPCEEVKKTFNDAKGKVEKLKDSAESTRVDMVTKAKAVLNENQVVIVSEYKACLIPIKSLTNPARIGQASDNSAVEKLLDRAREAPQQQYDRLKDKVVQKALQKLGKHYEKEELPALEETIRRTIDEARSLSQADYELKKPELVRRLSPKDMEPRKGKALNGAIERFLLSAEAIPALERTAAQAK